MKCISISHHTADAAFRQKFAFHEKQKKNLLQRATQLGASSCVVLCTCNRSEVYFCEGAEEDMLALLAEMGNVDKAKLKNVVMIFEKEKAIRHLFKTACGLNSMVLGEDEILGQLKQAFAFSVLHGCNDYTLNVCFQKAITCAKKIKTETLLSKSSVSIATLAAWECENFKAGDKQVLLIGASGDTGGKILKNLLSYPDMKVTATVRNGGRLHGEVKVTSYEDRYLAMDEADIIISATSSPHYTVTADRFLQQAKTKKKRLFVDVAMPADMDCELEKTEGCKVIHLDDLKDRAKENNRIKLSELPAAETMIEEQIDTLCKELIFHRFLEEKKRLFEEIPEGVDKFVYRYRDVANAEDFFRFIENLKRVYE